MSAEHAEGGVWFIDPLVHESQPVWDTLSLPFGLFLMGIFAFLDINFLPEAH